MNFLRRLLQKLFRSPPAVQKSAGQWPASWEQYRPYVSVEPSAIIDPASTLKIFNVPDVVRPLVRVGAQSHIFGHLNILRPEGQISIGARCQIGNSHFICSEKIVVEDDVLMAWGIVLMDNDAHSLNWEHRKNDVLQCYEDYKEDRKNFIRNKDWTHVSARPIRIGSRSWLGFNSIVLKGVSLGQESVVAAGSVVTQNVSDKTVVAGNPARAVRKVSGLEEDRREDTLRL